MSAPKPYFAPIDGVRSLCVLLVMDNHLKANGYGPSFINGHLGVDIFFVISGFLISTLLLREERAKGRINLSAFYWRRVFRILPIYSVVLLLYVVVCQLPSQAARWVQLKAGLPYFLLFVNEYVYEPNHGNVFTHTWSLGVEEKFYLFWPLLFFIVVKKMPARGIMLACLFVPLMVAAFVGPAHLPNSYLGLLIGCLMAVLLDGGAKAGLARMLRQVPSPVILLLFLSGFYLERLDGRLMLIFSVTTTLFLSYLIVKPTWLSALFSLPVLVWLGRRSYSMYLVHVLCLNVFEASVKIDSSWKAILVLGGSYALSAAVAAVLFVAIEEPACKFGRRFIARRQARAETLAAV
jgi:peptidoglycan/LPS O-acetylase OafA/YrhL